MFVDSTDENDRYSHVSFLFSFSSEMFVSFVLFQRLSNEFLSGLIRVQTDAFEIVQFILSFIPDQLSAGESHQSILSS